MAQASFDFINNRFYDQKIKVQKVIFQDCSVQEFGDQTILGTDALFFDAFGAIVFNPATGNLEQLGVPVAITAQLAGTPFLTNTTVLPDKIVNQGVVPVRVLVNGVAQTTNILQIPWQGILDVPGAAPGDTVQKHDVQLEGLPVSFVLTPGSTTAVQLIFKAILNMCVIVTSERVLKVNAAQEFC